MALPRKRHVQQPLYFGDKNGQRRGDPTGRKRKKGVKLGRPPKGPRSSERHEVRAAFKPSQPVHVTLRAIDEVGRLRTAAVYRAVREALIMTLWREACRIDSGMTGFCAGSLSCRPASDLCDRTAR